MEPSNDSSSDNAARTAASAYLVRESLGKWAGWRKPSRSTVPDVRTRTATTHTPEGLHAYLSQSEKERGTYLYLAYGSNLSNETFRGNRGIKPLSQVNVQVPELRLTFDLPGIPYTEPCFANTAHRDPENDPPSERAPVQYSEKTPLLSNDKSKTQEYNKDKWHKGLIGVVYEVTPEDYAHIIATEGGGSSYHDILVDCHTFASSDPAQTIPFHPDTPPFKAHTLFAPATPEGEQPPKDGGRFQRPDTSYAQASARYLKLLTDGATERQLPYEYQDFLHSLQPYTITTQQQRLGLFVFQSLWWPIVFFIFGLQKMFNDDKGQAPRWLKILAGAIFQAIWGSYDGFFKDIFGDGERTIPDKHDGDEEQALLSTHSRSHIGDANSSGRSSRKARDDEKDSGLIQ
ncbi:hypothetical protein H2203_001552 [Taxawa tesnikishii (nom. ined.)]|nr:hypothetical protein H2203_001552 [Dothideales sp. JES 119]